jgi:hypothetical protein
MADLYGYLTSEKPLEGYISNTDNHNDEAIAVDIFSTL